MILKAQKRFILLAIMFLGLLSAVYGSSKGTGSGWKFPNDRAWIKSKSKPRPYQVWGLPEGTTIVEIEYRAPGLLVSRPGGWWQFEHIGKIYYRNHPFALIGTRTALWIDQNNERHYISGLATVLIYDEDGDGRFETVVDLPIAGGPEVQIPAWALQ